MGVLAQVTMEQQRSDQWCWAAVTSSVFRTLQGQPITQEDVVCQILANEDCRLNPTPEICNIPFSLESAIQRICKCGVGVRGVLPFGDVQTQIDEKGHPLPISITFQTQFGSVVHYCLIKGCNAVNGNEEVILLDPAHMDAGESHVPYADLLDGSVLGAAWTQSYVIQ